MEQTIVRRASLPVAVAALTVLCSPASADHGTTAPNLFAFWGSARLGALAAGVAIEGDAGTVTLNPATLASVDRVIVSADYLDWYLDTYAAHVGVVVGPLGADGALGVDLAYVSEGEVTDFDPLTGEYGESFENSRVGITVGYGFSLPRADRVDVGMSLSFSSHRLLDKTAAGLSVGGGTTFKLVEDVLQAGLSFRDVGTREAFTDSRPDPPPWTVAAGLCLLTPQDVWDDVALVACCDIVKSNNTDAALAFGLEVTLFDVLSLRMGRDQGTGDAPMRFGLGISLSGFQVDYAYATHEALGQTSGISISRQFVSR